MSTPADTALPSRAAALARGVTATWWYTASSVVMFQALTLFFWFIPTAFVAFDTGTTWNLPIFLAGAALCLASSVPLLAHYRRRAESDDAEAAPGSSRWLAWSLVASAAGALAAGLATGSALCGLSEFAFAVCLLHWRPGVRLRVVVAAMLVLIVAWAVESQRPQPDIPGTALVYPVFSIFLPPAGVVTLWWWDIVVALDRARAAESRLAAAQERLRLASDLHDLQGHHLQVIALQLELADRMLERDPAAAGEQVRLARASVDEARRGTRELAERFRGVPLPDELANAADLLRAAGLRVELSVAPDAVAAPAEVLGPVIRESTTNVLKHGDGEWARLDLTHGPAAWTLTIANDADVSSAEATDAAGSGLIGMAERVAAAGGTFDVRRGAVFEVTASVPAASGATSFGRSRGPGAPDTSGEETR